MKPWYLCLFLWFFARLCYRLQVVRADCLPGTGGALLVSNHVSFVDMLLILASTDRCVRFVLPEDTCALRWLKPWLRRLQVIPLPDEKRSRELDEALRQARDAIRAGEVVGIFAENEISRIGVMLPFRGAVERIMEGLEAPVIPVCLEGVWGSIFSFQAGRFFWKIPRRLPYPVSVSFGQPLPARATPLEVRAAIQALSTEAWPCRRRLMKPLGRTFVQGSRHHPFRFAMADPRVGKLSFARALVGTVLLARRLRAHWVGQKMVGVCLPPSVGGALVNFAALLAGKVPVNLNYTLSAQGLASCARQCELNTIVSSRQFLDRAKLTLPCPTLLLEELMSHPGFLERVTALALAWLAPVRSLERAAGCERRPELDDLATVVFSSGSTGEPKGIMLSHFNILSNVEQIGQTFDFGPQQRFIGLLPFFHSFGFTATLMEPALCGFGVVYQPNPLEGKAVGELVRRYGVTTLMATPKFLQIYLQKCDAAEFGSLSFVMVGAEKLPGWLATEFQRKFGIMPVEGYGCTECSPVISANTHDYRGRGIYQRGNRRGTIGPPLPGVSLRIVDPGTLESLPVGQPGLLLVRGPNVMQGYLNQPDKTNQVLRDGWYNTGDIAKMHEDGFLEITDRLSRFSKIGGEMVPHAVVEEKLHEMAGLEGTRSFAVTGLRDEKKGEQLAVLHLLDEELLATVLKKLLAQNALPNLWIPKMNLFFRVEKIPVTGMDKLDLGAIRAQAALLAQQRERATEPPAAIDFDRGKSSRRTE